MKKLGLVLMAFTIVFTAPLSHAFDEVKDLCSVSIKTKITRGFEDEESFLSDSIDQCICIARNKVIGRHLENKAKKVRVTYMEGRIKKYGPIFNRKTKVEYKEGLTKDFSVNELRNTNTCR